MPQPNSSITAVPEARQSDKIVITGLGASSLSALAQSVKDAQADNPFTRVVVIVDHQGVAGAVRHWLGAQGTINVTVQTGERLSSELAGPLLRSDQGEGRQNLRPLTPLDEGQAVRRVVDQWLDTVALRLSPVGRERLYAEVLAAFREKEQRPNSEDAGLDTGAASFDLPRLYSDFRELLNGEGFYTRYEIPGMAAKVLTERSQRNDDLAVIYYLPRHASAGELELMLAQLRGSRCRVIVGQSGDGEADAPVNDLLGTLGSESGTQDFTTPLEQAVGAGGVSVAIAPDPVEEVRTVVRRIAAMSDQTPFHRIAVIHRMETPYASLVRQELDCAGIPYSGIPRRTLADTPAGRLLLGALGLAAGLNDGIDRETLLDLVGSAPVRFPVTAADLRTLRQRGALVPATHWVRLTREARANGTVEHWKERLDAYARQQAARQRERWGDGGGDGNGPDDPASDVGRPDIDALISFLTELESRLKLFRSPSTTWDGASEALRKLVSDYLADGEADADSHDRILRLLEEMESLATWNSSFDLDVLRNAISDGLRSPVSDRGNPVGSGVYVGPPAGIVGTEYSVVFAVGMMEGQFPPPPRVSAVSEWLDTGNRARTQLALERYDFLGAVASAGNVVLSYPAAGADRRAAYPSRWLLEAANLLHQATLHGGGRLTSDNLASDGGSKPWLSVTQSREDGLRQLATSPAGGSANSAAADVSDYNLCHLLTRPRGELASHPAIAGSDRLVRALSARVARLGSTLTRWDGLVGDGSPRVAAIGTPDRPVSASALETWATCPYRFFLSRVLGLYGPPSPEDDEISALDRGTLVHRILERFVNEKKTTEADLLQLAEEEFATAEAAGFTGYRLLWEMEKEAIRGALSVFFAADEEWLGSTPDESRAEVAFDAVDVEVAGLGTVRFRGLIDRMDVLGDEVRVRDFKTGRPDAYTSRSTTRTAYTVANGRALQLPVYTAAARQIHPEADIRASYSFPLSDDPARVGRPYTERDDLEQFHITLRRILGMARAGTFPATPDGGGEYSSCRFCDFNRLCPTRRRQIWERKGRLDAAVRRFNGLEGRAAIAGNGDAD